ncbi:MAG: S-layer homology domain-containing protein [Candidatus Sericytochromatia bacterium]
MKKRLLSLALLTGLSLAAPGMAQTAPDPSSLQAPAQAPEAPLGLVDPALSEPQTPITALPGDPPSSALPDAANLDTGETVLQSGSLYHSEWAQDSVQVLQENGIQLPQGINYGALISQDDFIRLLAQVSAAPVPQLREGRLNLANNSDAMTRGEAIHLVLGAFGLTESLPAFANQPSKFSDLPKSHPAYASVVLAESVHLINGYPDRTIRPDERLSWGEGLILIETVYSWRKALPTTAPEWVQQFQRRENMWYQLIDGFRLLLTLAYMVLALYFLGKTWNKARKQRTSPYRNFSFGLAIVTVLLAALWVSELLFNYALIPREIYASLAMLSVFAGLMLLKMGSDLDSDIGKPKPQVVIDAGYIVSLNTEKGEVMIRDKATDSHSLALIGSDAKILRKTGRKSVESSFVSDLQVGDLVSLRGSRLEHEALMEVERLTVVEPAQQQVESQSQNAVREYVRAPQKQQKQQQVNRNTSRRPR